MYEKIELPPIKAIVTQIRRYGGKCECCEKKYRAEVEPELEKSSPFGESIREKLIYLRYGHGISYCRLKELMKEIYGISISEGAIANILLKTRKT